MKICSIDECDKSHYGLGYCNLHWRRFKKTGDVQHTRKPKYCTLLEAYEAHVIKKHPDECWGWAGKTDSKYGVTRFKINNRYVRAHRAAYILSFGAIPKGLYVCHRCDNPPCTNPNHLFLGTNLENIEDCISKNRQAKGEMLKQATINDKVAQEIKTSLANGLSMAGISREFGVSYYVVRGIKDDRTWKHIKGEAK